MTFLSSVNPAGIHAADEILHGNACCSHTQFAGRTVQVRDEFSHPGSWFSVTLDRGINQTAI
jgi:hypothetical protein